MNSANATSMTNDGSTGTAVASSLGSGPSQPSVGYGRLRTFLTQSMSMSHVYQPLMIRTILAGGGAATRRQIAAAFLSADLSQLEYYEEITKGYPTQTLKRHGIIEHTKGVYRLLPDAAKLSEWERASLVALCDAKVADYVAQRQDAIWRHRAQNFDPVPGSLRYLVLQRARGRCEACGISNQERAVQVDHIVPRTKGGTNELSNLQALCSACNGQKLDRDATDFRSFQELYDARDRDCALCCMPPDRILIANELAFAIRDGYPVTSGHTLIIPKRHVADHLGLGQPEVNAVRELELRSVEALRLEDPTIAGFNIGINAGAAAGQTIFHCHIHVIPRRPGDTENPRGGVRRVIPAKQSY